MASTPTDILHLPDTAVKEGEGRDPEGKVEMEAETETPKGAPLAQETPTTQDRVCGWVMSILGNVIKL